jgi:hypothetical protein
MAQPKASRPHIPGYGISKDAEGMLPWAWAEERLTAAHNYWVAVSKPDGAPHMTPVWGVWSDGAFWFSTGGAMKTRALAADARCVISTERADEAVIVEGTAAKDNGRATLREVIQAYNAKYAWDFDPEKEDFYAVRPVVVFGFIEHAGEFARTATRWTFET